MTVFFADPFDIPQFSKKYSVILKGQRPRSCSATCKLLCISCLIEIRVPDFGNDSPYLFTPMYEASFKGTKR